MKRPPLWVAAGAEVQKHKQNVQSKYSTSHSSPQPALAQRLAQLERLRRDADAWRTAGAHGWPPQPSAYGLRLGSLGSSEIYWRSS